METINKRKEYAFGKDVFLLGKTADGDYIWLESAQWDCDWYWGFGYVEVYTNQLNPQSSRDINSHSHWDGLLNSQTDGSYKHHINEILVESVLTDNESWELADLMKSFYTLKESAEMFERGYSYLSAKGKVDSLFKTDLVTEINEQMMPDLFKRIYSLLTPASEVSE